MTKMTQHITIIQPRHRQLRHDHLQERAKRRKDAELVRVEPEARGGGEVAALHDPRGHEHFRVLLVDDFEARGAFEVA
jgi:hypothetical protein